MADAPKLALSIMQPWAWLIAHGHKDIENRDWKPYNPGLRFRGRFLIHTGKRIDPDFEDEGGIDWSNWTWPDIEMPEGFEVGGIVGEAEIVVGHIWRAEFPEAWFFPSKLKCAESPRA